MKENQARSNEPNSGDKPEEFVTFCGGIKPIVIPELKEGEKEECTELF